MLNNLVIVESPAKAKTIEKFLGKDYTVMSSYGHIRDLKKKHSGIDIANDFTPDYEIPADKEALVARLRKAAAQAKTVWLASDEDREGEAIAWHLCQVLGLDPRTAKRIVFHEITKSAILHAIGNPRAIDLDRVDAQQARRVLDRLVGFELSPVLWKKIKPALSAGRVQSVAVRLIAEREEQIRDFTPEAYWRVHGRFVPAPGGTPFKAELARRLDNDTQAAAFLDQCSRATFTVGDLQTKPVTKSPAPPFTTSTLQQEAARKLGFTVSQTMLIAQQLYEAGHITYMRTDSLNLSSQAIEAISREITDNLGAAYLKVRHYHTKSKGAQEAHEAIRPTYMDRETIDAGLREQKLYTLIRQRTLASQMADAQMTRTTATINISTAPDVHFTATGQTVNFDGFLKVYLEGHDDDTDDTAAGADEAILPGLAPGQQLQPLDIQAAERYTQQPPRYTEATLVRKMEELGIGRPSTYAPTISTIQSREYVEKGHRPGQTRTVRTLTLDGTHGTVTPREHTETFGADNGKLMPTDTGIVVNKFLTENFPNILDYNFTAKVEEKFDRIAEGTLRWTDEMHSFYDSFHPDVETAMNTRLEHRVGERVLGTDPATGRQVSVKIGRFGPMVQLGTPDTQGGDKPQFASLLKTQKMDTVTLDEALALFAFPKTLGEADGLAVTVGLGRFGPYVHHGDTYASIPAGTEPGDVDMEQALQLIGQRRQADAQKYVRRYDNDPDLTVQRGRYGIYIKYRKDNYKIPAYIEDPAALTYDEAMEIVRSQQDADGKPVRKTTRKTTAGATKTTAKTRKK